MQRSFATLAGLLWMVTAANAGTLFEAAKEGNTATVNKMLLEGAAVDERGPNDATPLIAAALAGNPDTVKTLITAGADVMARNRSGFTPLHAAAYGGHLEIVRLLLNNGSDLEARTNRAGQTPIYMAADEAHIDVVEHLLEQGADVVTVDKSGFSVLVRALFRKHEDVAGLLKQYGATCPGPDLLGEDFQTHCIAVGQ